MQKMVLSARFNYSLITNWSTMVSEGGDDTPAEADAFFPELNPEEWAEFLREEHPADEKHVQAYTFIDYTRK